MTTESYLAERWERTLSAVRPPVSKKQQQKLLREIFVRYSEVGRYYHTLDHLSWCFQVLEHDMAKLAGTATIELALWYHDVIYNTRGKGSEEASALLAEDRIERAIGMSRAYALQVGNLIRATTHQVEPGTREAKVLLDLDLSILSAPADEFDTYERNIRKEYAWVPEGRYREGRLALLNGFLARTWVYATPEFREGPREGMARTNLSRSVAALSDDHPTASTHT